MGVFYLLFYIFGGAVIALSSKGAMHTLLRGEPLTSFTGFGVGAVLIAGAAILHASSEKRGGNLETAGDGTPVSWRGVLIGFGVMAVPTLAAWAQFEFHVDPLAMFPMITVLGALIFIFALASRVTHNWPLRSVARLVAIAFFGIPLGLLAVAIPMGHFTHHLTTVHVVVTDSTSSHPKTLVVDADEPVQVREVDGIGEGMGGIISALANAKTIDIDEEVAAGRMKRLEDGTLLDVNADGTVQPMLGVSDLKEMMAEAQDEDESAAKAKHDARKVAFDRKVERRRMGGRLFSSPAE